MKLHLKRNIFGSTCTLGVLDVDDVFYAYTLEDRIPKCGKERWTKETAKKEFKIDGETCIPSGEYEIMIDFSQHFNRVLPHVLGVPLFEGIRIHPGNSEADTEGCLLVGKSIGAGFKLVDSRIAFDSLMKKLSNTSEKIQIVIE